MGYGMQRTPLHLAAVSGHESICLALVLAGANRLGAVGPQHQIPAIAERARIRGHTALANHMQHSNGVYILRCTGPSCERKLAWNGTSEAEEEAMLDVMQAQWLAKVAQGRAHARVGHVLRGAHRRQLSTRVLTCILGFAVGGTAAHLIMSCVSQRPSVLIATVEHAATAEPPQREGQKSTARAVVQQNKPCGHHGWRSRRTSSHSASHRR
jgi:hypothetical protein